MTELNPDQAVTLAALHARYTRANLTTADNQVLVAELTIEEALRLQSEGLLADDMPTQRDLEEQWLRARLTSGASSEGRKVKRRLAEGQSLLDLGSDYDAVFTVCGVTALRQRGQLASANAGRVTTLGEMTADDVALMAVESRSNRTKVDIADDRVQETAPSWIRELRRYANYKQMVARGGEAAS